MIKFDKPTNLNGAELLAELAAVGITLQNKSEAPVLDGNGDFWLDIKSADEAKAALIIATHNGTTIAPDNSATKAALLAKLGITADELKTLLS